MNFDKVNLIDLVVVVGLVLALLASLFIGLDQIAISIISGLLGYIGAKHVGKVEKKDDDVNGTS